MFDKYEPKWGTNFCHSTALQAMNDLSSIASATIHVHAVIYGNPTTYKLDMMIFRGI